ncbi:MAG: spore coat protein U domain-containing protein [Hydrogenophaga sp.]|uniref:spore coat protein U domain-containing protein n=1 Tax=Hydrogenophaga sp. TaxID=1904254 RepID=UPI003D0CD516
MKRPMKRPMGRTPALAIFRVFAAAVLLGLGPCAHAAYSCTVSATSTGLIYEAPSPRDVTGSATLTCTRSPGDASTLSYRLKATDGLHASGTNPIRRVRLGSSGNLLFYSLRRGASCNNNTNWRAPATGTTDVQTGTLNFGAGLVASTTLAYCNRVRVGAGGNPPAPAAGVYTDTFSIFAQYPTNKAGALSPDAPVSLTVGVSNQCVFNSYPGSLVFNYTAFSSTAQTASTAFLLRCSTDLPWTITVDPAATTLLGLRYEIAPSPSSGIGNGNTGQSVTLTGTMQAGQAGACATSFCTGSQQHTVFIHY